MMAIAGFLRDDSNKAVRLVNWVWAVAEEVGGVRAEMLGGCCGGGSGARWCRDLENLFRADMPP